MWFWCKRSMPIYRLTPLIVSWVGLLAPPSCVVLKTQWATETLLDTRAETFLVQQFSPQELSARLPTCAREALQWSGDIYTSACGKDAQYRISPLERDHLGKLVCSAAALRLFMVTDHFENSVEAIVPPHWKISLCILRSTRNQELGNLTEVPDFTSELFNWGPVTGPFQSPESWSVKGRQWSMSQIYCKNQMRRCEW